MYRRIERKMLLNYINPGICTEEAIMKIDEKLFKEVALFLDDLKGKIVDIGCINAKSLYISKSLNVSINQIDCDFNFNKLPVNKYDKILCLEVLEHLQNPLFFMKNLKLMLRENGIIYLSMPARPRILWTKHHFFEMNKKHFDKWILKPLGLRITKSKRIRIKCPFWFCFIGFRPLLRFFFNYTYIYKINEKYTD